MKCRSCGGQELETILELGKQAWCNNFLRKEQLGEEPAYPLTLVRCNDCTLVQLDYTVPKETMFLEHTYVSGTTKSLAKHFLEVAVSNSETFKDILHPDSLIVDIGGNDGTQLMQYRSLGFKNLLNVESATNIAKIATENGIPTDNAFFNEDYVVHKLHGKKAKLINASGVFFHLEELHSVIKGIKLLLDDDGVFVVQFMYLGDMIAKTSFDGIYHEHLCYYSIQSLINLLEPYGLDVFDVQHSAIHGGSMIARVCHKWHYKATASRSSLLKQDIELCSKEQLLKFAKQVQDIKATFLSLVEKIRGTGKRICGIGAPAKGNTLLTYFGLDNKVIDVIYEANPLKVGLYTPISHIPIVKEDISTMTDTDNSIYLILSWNFTKEIMSKYPAGTQFLTPFPPTIIGK